MNIVRRWLSELFPPVTRSDAIRIAREAVLAVPVVRDVTCYARKPANFHIYANLTEPCWWIVVPRNDGLFMLRSSRVMVVGKQTGRIFYDGDAGDEG